MPHLGWKQTLPFQLNLISERSFTFRDVCRNVARRKDKSYVEPGLSA